MGRPGNTSETGRVASIADLVAKFEELKRACLEDGTPDPEEASLLKQVAHKISLLKEAEAEVDPSRDLSGATVEIYMSYDPENEGFQFLRGHIREASEEVRRNLRNRTQEFGTYVTDLTCAIEVTLGLLGDTIICVLWRAPMPAGNANFVLSPMEKSPLGREEQIFAHRLFVSRKVYEIEIRDVL